MFQKLTRRSSRPHRPHHHSWLLWLAWTMLAVAVLLPASTTALAAQQADQPQEEGKEEGKEEEKEKSERPATYFHDRTTVTATGSETDTFQVAAPVIVIDYETIEERQPYNASDLLRTEPGVDVNGVGPNQMRPIIRGQRGLRVLFMENGLRLNNARRQTDFGEVTSLVDIGGVETMEVVRGPASVLYGSDAIGGVLNLIPSLPSTTGPSIRGNFSALYSSADEQGKASGGFSGHSEKWSYSLAGTYRDTSDYDAPAGTFGDITLVSDTPVVDTGIRDDWVNAFLGRQLNDPNRIYLRYNRYRAGETGFGFVDPTQIGESDDFQIRITYPFQDFDRFVLGWESAGLNGFADDANVQIYRQENERQLANDIFIDIGPAFGAPPNSDIVFDTLNTTNLDTFGIRAEFTKRLAGRNLLTYGGEYFGDDSTNTDYSEVTTTLRAPFPLTFICGPPGGVPFPFECAFTDIDDVANTPNADNKAFGLFIQDQWEATDKLAISLGLRYADTSTKAKETPGWDVNDLDFADDAVVGALNLRYSVHRFVNLVASYGTAFRAPNIVERLFNGLTPEGIGYQILNPELVSETSSSFDLGVKFRNVHAYFEAMYFDSEIDDAIVQYTLSDEEVAMLPLDIQDEIEMAGVSFVVQQRNADVLRVKGFELAGGYRFDKGISMALNYTNWDGESETGGPAADPTGETFSEKIVGSVRYDQRSGRYWAEYRIRHNGEQDQQLDPGAIPGPLGEVLPAFTVHTLAGGVKVFENDRQRHMVGVVIDNLTNELYAEFSNASFFRPQPKRSFMLTYRVGVQ